MQITLNADGSLTITRPQLDKAGAAINGPDGKPQASVLNIEAHQVAAHRRDPDIEAALPDDVRAALDKAK